MGKVTGFLEIDRQTAEVPAGVRSCSPLARIHAADGGRRSRAGRRPAAWIAASPIATGDTGCPVHNQIPDWNDLIYNGDWEEAARNLHSTNNFPEFTGRICPAPCEEACTLEHRGRASIAIKNRSGRRLPTRLSSLAIFARSPLTKRPASASPSSAPARPGFAAAQQLARVGHEVHVYERETRTGGLLRYGIPDFKMEKRRIDRRIEQMKGEGVTFFCGVEVGVTKPARELIDGYDAVLLVPMAASGRAIPAFRAANLRASTTPWPSSCSRTAGSGARP